MGFRIKRNKRAALVNIPQPLLCQRGSPQRSEKGPGRMVQPGMSRTSGILAGKVGDVTCQSCSHTELVELLALTAKGQGHPPSGHQPSHQEGAASAAGVLTALMDGLARAREAGSRCGGFPLALQSPGPHPPASFTEYVAFFLCSSLPRLPQTAIGSGPDSLPCPPAPAPPSFPGLSVCWPRRGNTLSSHFSQAQGSLLLLSCRRQGHQELR